MREHGGRRSWDTLSWSARYLEWRYQYKKWWFGAAHSENAPGANMTEHLHICSERGWMRKKDLICLTRIDSVHWLKLSRGGAPRVAFWDGNVLSCNGVVHEESTYRPERVIRWKVLEACWKRVRKLVPLFPGVRDASEVTHKWADGSIFVTLVYIAQKDGQKIVQYYLFGWRSFSCSRRSAPQCGLNIWASGSETSEHDLETQKCNTIETTMNDMCTQLAI